MGRFLRRRLLAIVPLLVLVTSMVFSLILLLPGDPAVALIGDAAHVMSPVGGVGINYAIQDATVASNMLASPLKAGHVEVSDLAKVQSDRELPTRIIQAAQSAVQKRIIANVFSSPNGLRIPTLLRLALRIPFVRDIPARLIAFGVHRAHVA